MWARIGVLLAAILVSLVITGAGQVSSAASGPEDPRAARAVAVLTGIEDGPIHDAVPEDFADVMGYRPEIVNRPDGAAHVVKPTGDCSTPFGATRYDFQRVCRTHDYGYDLLRYASKRDGELGPWARVAVDDLLGEDLRRRCEQVDGGAACRAVATAGEGIIKANSWRQGQGIPGREDAGPYVASGVLIAAAVVGPPVIGRLRRRAANAPFIAVGKQVAG
ncbi:hypothetical protein [Phytoactinopolyspora halophila]|nr:hypothetical protein [Phytoactinopolyspora halophila]